MEEYNFSDTTQTLSWNESAKYHKQPLFILELPKSRDPISPYLEEIFENLREQEVFLKMIQCYVPYQSITYNQMSQLIDWVIDAVQCMDYRDETLYLAINIIGRYLNKQQINLQQLQLLAICSINIAAKYEEKKVGQVKLSKLGFDYTNQQIVCFEGDILIALNFQITIPYPQQFVWYYAHQLFNSREQVVVTEYLIEISYFSLHQISASLLALSAVYLVLKYSGIQNPWYYLSHLERKYSLELVDSVSEMLNKLFQAHFQDKNQMNLQQKFVKTKYLQIASKFQQYFQSD